MDDFKVCIAHLGHGSGNRFRVLIAVTCICLQRSTGSEEVLKQLNAMDRYARRVFSRSKFAIRELDAAQQDNSLKTSIGA